MQEWTKEERKSAVDLLDPKLDCTVVETHGHHGYNPLIIDLQCEATALREALESIKSYLDADDEGSYRSDDPEGAMDSSFSMAIRTLANIPK